MKKITTTLEIHNFVPKANKSSIPLNNAAFSDVYVFLCWRLVKASHLDFPAGFATIDQKGQM